MKLENLKQFDWLNEPLNVMLTGAGLKITALPKTDFWQSKHHDFAKDDGHFFYTLPNDNFCCTLKWHFDTAQNYNQCGLMLRFNAENWFKISIMSLDDEHQEIATCVTSHGVSDWAGSQLTTTIEQLWYKLRRNGDDFVAFYSLDGINYIRLRQFYLPQQNNPCQMGAYICSPSDAGFVATLEEINFSDK